MTTTDNQAWTCPTPGCGKTVTIGLLSQAQWQRHRIWVQRDHATRHDNVTRQS